MPSVVRFRGVVVIFKSDKYMVTKLLKTLALSLALSLLISIRAKLQPIVNTKEYHIWECMFVNGLMLMIHCNFFI